MVSAGDAPQVRVDIRRARTASPDLGPECVNRSTTSVPIDFTPIDGRASRGLLSRDRRRSHWRVSSQRRPRVRLLRRESNRGSTRISLRSVGDGNCPGVHLVRREDGQRDSRSFMRSILGRSPEDLRGRVIRV